MKGFREQRRGLSDALDRSDVSSSLNDMADCWDWHILIAEIVIVKGTLCKPRLMNGIVILMIQNMGKRLEANCSWAAYCMGLSFIV